MSAIFPRGNNTCHIDTAFGMNMMDTSLEGDQTGHAKAGERAIYPNKVGTVKGSQGDNGRRKFLFNQFTNVDSGGGVTNAKDLLPPWGGKNQITILIALSGQLGSTKLIEGIHYDSTFDKGFSESSTSHEMPTASGSYITLRDPAGADDDIILITYA